MKSSYNARIVVCIGQTRGGRLKTGLAAAVVFLATLSLVLSPLAQNFRKNPQDNFPLSYYPMFRQKHDRSTASVAIEHFIGIRKDGSELNLPSRKISTVNRCHLRLLVHAGKSENICREAARTAKGIDQFRDLESVALVRDTYRRDDFYSPPYKPIAREVHAIVALSSFESPGR